ncbi:GDYXXLXY domain-containing protein [Cyclobacterium jeungdonense]|uniref:GDYXXLXY domain-containing protein n=1 Tax=Cyclobacterium jeungdonense TaxID=708087 RepID=A0ABT8C3W3_9BACT|nr:GDYXXLXY domain-containing protein [Cyclobacterium jeungdonense]MDN3686991.1 GDYXXLXY domain-containing protein [Cyclobacterium jeungdonense]
MDNKKIIVTAFFLVALVQLYVPAKMIWNREEILNTGTAYKFKTAPVDPNDPFIGKYITLSYDENTFPVPNKQDWKPGEPIYVSLQTDTYGFAKIASISKIKPSDNNDYIKAKVRFLSGNDSNMLTIDYPFDRFYMEESKAYDAELAYRQFQRDTSNPTYALVSIKNGEAVLKDVMIGGTSIKEMVKSNQKER